jgi:DNA mismatch repair protein MutS2
MDAHTMDKLEFGRINELLSCYAGCALGRELALRVRPVHSAGRIRLWLEQVREMLWVQDSVGLPPFGGISDVRPEVRSAVPPAKLEPEELARIADTLQGTHQVRDWVDRLPSEAEHLSHLGQRIGDFQALAMQINEAIDGRGQVRDHATPRLLNIRSRIVKARDSIGEVVSKLIHSPKVQRFLQYPNATFHNDRTVLPLKAEYRGRIEGIVHRSSESGATLFIEPAPVVELNNTIIKLRYEEHEEITRLLWHLTRLIHVNMAQVLETLDALAVLDLISAKVRMARHLRMHVAELNDEQALNLRQARHPLLLTMRAESDPQAEVRGQEPDASFPAPPEPNFDRVVPIDFRLGEDFDLMVLTGPNTGGKTVTLKTVGLMAAMHQAGLPIPAEPGSRLPVFDDVLIDVGDEQSLQQSLSTFSAHLVHVLATLRRSTPRTLVLIDELGAGTDPDEGAAIGRAVMDELLRIGCRTVITSHLGALKSQAYTHPRVENAGVEFDLETLKPTYKLHIGEAGSSNALAVARRLGLPRRLVAAAEQHLSERYKAFSQAIAGTVESRRRAERALKQAEKNELQAVEAREEYEKRAAELLAKQEAFDRWCRYVTTLKPGDRVYVKSFSHEGTVVRLQLQRQVAVVVIGAVEAEVSLSEIQPEAAG